MSEPLNTIKCRECKFSKDHLNNTYPYLLSCTNPNPLIKPQSRYEAHFGERKFEHDHCCGYGILLLKNSKHKKTLKKIFEKPTPNDILWSDVESLLKHVGCTLKYQGGSSVKITKDSESMFAHRPHPTNQSPPRLTKRFKIFLEQIGVIP